MQIEKGIQNDEDDVSNCVIENEVSFDDLNEDLRSETYLLQNRQVCIQKQKELFRAVLERMFHNMKKGKKLQIQNFKILDEGSNTLTIMIHLDQFSQACVCHCFIIYDFQHKIIESRSYISDFQGKMIKVEEKVLFIHIKYLNRLLLRYFTKINQSLKSGAFYIENKTQHIMFKILPLQMQEFWAQIFDYDNDFGQKNGQLEELISSITFTHHYAIQFHVYRICYMINKFSEDDLKLLEKDLNNQMKKIQPGTQKHLENVAYAIQNCNTIPSATDHTQYQSYFQVTKQNSNQQLKIFTTIYLAEQIGISDFNSPDKQFETTGFSELYRTEVTYSLQPHGQDRIKKVMAIKIEKDRKPQSSSNRIIHEKNILKKLTSIKQGYSPFIAMSFEAAESGSGSKFKNVLFTEFYYHSSLDKFKSKFSITQSLNTKLYILSQIALGLSYIHSCTVIHNDIKPGNIFISKNYLVKISDFGEAKCPNVETAGGSGLTFPYGSPELILRKPDIQSQSDVFSFGILMYEYLFDCYPIDYKKSNTDNLIERYKKNTQVLRSNQDFIKKKGPKKLMTYLRQLSLLCLQTEPKQRPHLDWIVICLREALQYIEKMY